MVNFILEIYGKGILGEEVDRSWLEQQGMKEEWEGRMTGEWGRKGSRLERKKGCGADWRELVPKEAEGKWEEGKWVGKEAV